jgi:hypothetical protein
MVRHGIGKHYTIDKTFSNLEGYIILVCYKTNSVLVCIVRNVTLLSTKYESGIFLRTTRMLYKQG